MLGFKNKLFYGWIMVLSLLVIGINIWGVRISFGVFFKSIESDFNLNRATTSAVFSVNLMLGAVFAVLFGFVIDRYGPRIAVLLMGLFAGLGLLLTSQTNSLWQLFITYSLILPMGTGAIFTVIMATVSRWFDKNRGLALGIAGSGSGLGPMVMAPFATYLIASFDWRMALIIMGGITWVIVLPLSRVLRRDPHEIGILPDGVKLDSKDIKDKKEESTQLLGLSLLQALGTRSFWLILFVWLFLAFNLLFVLIHLVPHITDIGFSAGQAAAVLSVQGGAAAAGRVLLGIVSDRIGRKRTYIICVLFQGAATLCLIWLRDLWAFYLFALVYGIAYGGLAPSMVGLIGDTFGLRSMGAILGALDIGFGAGGALGPAIGGLIFDATSSYRVAFLIGGLVMFISALFVALIRRERGRNLGSGLKLAGASG